MKNYKKIKELLQTLPEEELGWVFGFLCELYFADDVWRCRNE